MSADTCARGRPKGDRVPAQHEGRPPGTALDDVKLFKRAVPSGWFAELRRAFPDEHVERLSAEGFHFYRTTFWYPLGQAAENIFESVINTLQPAADPPPGVIGAEWWFSVMHTNSTPQWLLPCHFDRNDLAEMDPRKLKHPDKSSVLFLNSVPYGELVITDQVLTEKGARPKQPQDMRFIRPCKNLYAVFPGHLYHGVIGRMWRPIRNTTLRVTMAVNWWSERPSASYLRDSRHCLAALRLAA